MISSFKWNYSFLSNFYEAPVQYRGMTYQNNEAAFQAAKTLDYKIRLQFANLDPRSAKKKGRSITLRLDWERVKFDVMHEVVLMKFSQNEDLKQKLLDTGDEELQEGNTWGDTTWGMVNGVGQNNLGKILMEVRKSLRLQDTIRRSL